MTGQNQYEVLSPWADADSTPLKRLSPRVTDLSDKTIGLLYNWKIAARKRVTEENHNQEPA